MFINQSENGKTLPHNTLIINASSTFSSNLLEEKMPALEKTRNTLAIGLFSTFALTTFLSLLFLFLSGFFYLNSNHAKGNKTSTLDKELITFVTPLKEVITLIITTESTFLGAAIGFYFGEKSGMKR